MISNEERRLVEKVKALRRWGHPAEAERVERELTRVRLAQLHEEMQRLEAKLAQ